MKSLVVALIGEECQEINTLLEGDSGLSVVGFNKTEVSNVADLMPDIILVTVSRKGERAVAICRELRQCPRTRPIPIVLMTELEEKPNLELALICGCLDYLSKSLGGETILKRLRVLAAFGKVNKSVRKIITRLECPA